MAVIAHYFREITTDGLSKGIVWEEAIRGELISLCSKFKKAHQADFQRVLDALQKAELQHKHSGDPESLKKLTDLRELILHLLDRQARKQV